MIKKVARVGLVALIATPMMFTTQGCTNGEVLGSIAIVAGAVAIGMSSGDRGHGGSHHSPPPPPPSHHRPGRRFSASAAIDAVASDSVADRIASKYGIPSSAAEKLAESLSAASQGDASKVMALGLSSKDFERLAEMRMITDDGLTRLAASLGMDKPATETLVQNVVDDFRQQASDSSSDYWQSCIRSGSWKTPQNLNCQEAYWSGCSPETGASMCVPAH